MSTSHGAAEPVGRLIYKGAEADILLGEWQGREAVFKVRKPLAYRLKVLDDSIRRQRTLREAEMIHRAKVAGVDAPFLYCVDPGRATLVVEYVRGDRVKDLLPASPTDETRSMFEEFGGAVGRLHSAGIMHGDLTTANVVRRSGSLVFMDFGLAAHTTRVEDHAVDLRLIKETLVGAHPGLAAAALDSLRRGYSKAVGVARSRSVFRQLGNIERRGRYARME